jgi:hypothetical protein
VPADEPFKILLVRRSLAFSCLGRFNFGGFTTSRPRPSIGIDLDVPDQFAQHLGGPDPQLHSEFHSSSHDCGPRHDPTLAAPHSDDTLKITKCRLEYYRILAISSQIIIQRQRGAMRESIDEWSR